MLDVREETFFYCGLVARHKLSLSVRLPFLGSCEADKAEKFFIRKATSKTYWESKKSFHMRELTSGNALH